MKTIRKQEQDRSREEREIIAIIKKFIFDFLKLMDDVQKAKRRA